MSWTDIISLFLSTGRWSPLLSGQAMISQFQKATVWARSPKGGYILMQIRTFWPHYSHHPVLLSHANIGLLPRPCVRSSIETSDSYRGNGSRNNYPQIRWWLLEAETGANTHKTQQSCFIGSSGFPTALTMDSMTKESACVLYSASSCLTKFRVAAGLSSVNYVILEMEALSQHHLFPQWVVLGESR